MTRDEFMNIVYSELHSDSDNYRANRIIDVADKYAEEKVTTVDDVLDKIRAEIIEMRSKQNVGVLECLDIIDKYKAESEVQE